MPRLSPFPFSDTNKRYYTFDYFLRRTFGGKIARIALNAGLGCPNRDGCLGTGGCSFCLLPPPSGTLREQYEAGLAAARRKWDFVGTIPYLQAGTNTYADPQRLTALYEECAALPGAVMLALGTRADCLGDGALDALSRIAKKIPVLVELGMQSASDATAAHTGRGYPHAVFLEGYRRLARIADGDRIRIGLHLINGLPGETEADMLASAREAARLRPDLVKLHVLCVLRGTAIAVGYLRGEYAPMARDEAAELICRQLTLLPPDVVIGRIGADAEKEILLAPAWARDKRAFADAVDVRMAQRGWQQGCAWRPEEGAGQNDNPERRSV